MWRRIIELMGRHKVIIAWGYLGLGLVALACGIWLTFGKRASGKIVDANQLIAQLQDRRLTTARRASACINLAYIKLDVKKAVPALMGAVSDSSFNVSCTAVYALGQIGPDAAEACPLLFRALRDWRTGGSSKGLGESFLTGAIPLSPAQNRVRNIGIWLETVTEALGAICTSDSKVLSALANLLNDTDPAVVTASCRLISMVATNLGPAEARLIQLTQIQNEFIKVSALCALGKPKPPQPSVMAAIINALSDPRPAVRECALDLLSDFGAPSAPAVKSILTVLAESNGEVIDPKYLFYELNPSFVAAANKKSHLASEYSVPSRLGDRREKERSHVRYKALRTLAAIGPAASEALPAVMKITKDDADPLRFEAAVTAFRLGISNDTILPPFTHALSDSSEDIRRISLGQLTRIARDCPGAVSVLARSLEDPNLLIRVVTVQALSGIGTNALLVLPALEKKASQDPKLAVRQAAKRLVEQLRQKKP